MEKELAKAFEETTTRNVQAILDHGNKTRKMIKNLEVEVETLKFMVRSQNNLLEQFRIQLAGLQAKVYQGGTV